MEDIIVACFDVYYRKNYAQSSCIVFKMGEETIVSEYEEKIEGIKDFVSGEFYKRELPCLLEILDKIKENINIIIVDSFVWVGENQKGLGAYLYESLGGKIPVIGVAKTYLVGSTDYLKIYRGKSIRPLFISSVGIDLNYSAEYINNLKGNFRIPDILKKLITYPGELTTNFGFV